MHKHLQLVREFHEKFAIKQANHEDYTHLPDMDIVMRQALLLECGSQTCQALAGGDISKVLAGLIDLAYNALAAIACQGGDVQKASVSWRQDGSILSILRVLSEKIHACSSGEIQHYSALYALCEQLTRSFINADFDLAIRLLHQHCMAQALTHPAENYQQRFEQETLTVPDLSAALYE